jgi:DNA repair exonuclease SbcCD nuclease subunit
MKLLIAADLHLRADQPRCRLDDDWRMTQTLALRQMVKYANENEASLCIVGDIFHPLSGKVPPWVENMFLRQIAKVKRGTFVLAGNHDLPNHSWSNVHESSFGVVWNSKRVQALTELGLASHFGEPFPDDNQGANTGLVFIHTLVFASAKELPPDEKAISAMELLAQFPNAKWIFTGDNHRHFHVEKNGRHVVNPGCLLRQAADFKDYQPGVYLVDLTTEEVIRLSIPDDGEMVTDAYIKTENDRKARIDAFIETVKTGKAITLDFQSNLETAAKDIDNKVAKMINSLVKEANGSEG